MRRLANLGLAFGIVVLTAGAALAHFGRLTLGWVIAVAIEMPTSTRQAGKRVAKKAPFHDSTTANFTILRA